MNNLLKAVEYCGLDLVSGKSNYIDRLEVEKIYGKHLTGNGSVIGYRFNGYKTIAEEISELKSKISSSKRRIKKEEQKVKERENKIKKLEDKEPHTQLYSEFDL